jgi:hypothetical protein
LGKPVTGGTVRRRPSLGPGREIAPGVHRLGDAVVNFYLIDEAEGLVLIR